MVPFIGSAA
jgi:hypothetical protein